MTVQGWARQICLISLEGIGDGGQEDERKMEDTNKKERSVVAAASSRLVMFMLTREVATVVVPFIVRCLAAGSLRSLCNDEPGSFGFPQAVAAVHPRLTHSQNQHQNR